MPAINQSTHCFPSVTLSELIKQPVLLAERQKMFTKFEIVHREFVPPNTTVNSDFYCDVLRRLRENVRRKEAELWRHHNWLLHHDNAPAHMSQKTTEFVTNNNMVIVPHPPYMPDLAPCDFALFPKLKMKLNERCFEAGSDIQRELQVVLDSIKENYFHGAFEAWKK
jgi:histone-lysine N-methyltransferase SETMAR